MLSKNDNDLDPCPPAGPPAAHISLLGLATHINTPLCLYTYTDTRLHTKPPVMRSVSPSLPRRGGQAPGTLSTRERARMMRAEDATAGRERHVRRAKGQRCPLRVLGAGE